MEKVWWNMVTNASQMVTKIITCIKEGKSVLLELNRKVPWYDTLSEIISEELTAYYADRSLKIVENMEGAPDEYLFNEFCKREKRAQYRPSIGYPAFLAQSDDIMLNQCIIWAVDVDTEKVTKWCDFIDMYNRALGKGKTGCLFLIETREKVHIPEKKGLYYISYENMIEHYDNYLFNMILSARLKESSLFKQYLAEVVSSMVPDDIELSALCIQKGRKFLKNPIKEIEEIVNSNCRSDGSSFTFDNNADVLSKRLWEAQIKVIFPLLEKQRNILISKYEKEIEPILPIYVSYGDKVESVKDVEIGILSFMVGNGKLEVEQQDRHKIAILKEARNKLAHISVMTQNEIDELLEL